jgi:hypothetical protein
MGYHSQLSQSDLHSPSQTIAENNTGSTINAFTVVKLNGLGSIFPQIQPISSFNDLSFGITTSNILTGSSGQITGLGSISGINTSSWTVGTLLYSDISGNLTSIVSSIGVGQVLKQDTVNGIVYIFALSNYLMSASPLTGSSLNSPFTLALRNGSGDFAAGTITANLLGSASTITGFLTGDVTSVGMNTSLASSVVTAKLLTGYSVGANTALINTDSILQAFQKVQGQINNGIGVNVTSVGASAPLSSSGGLTPNISISLANATTNGYLASADWNTFNNKQNAGNYITALTSDVSASGPGSASATVNSVGGSSAANIHAAELLANTATNLNTASALVKRDSFGNFIAGTINAALTGHASLDLALTGGAMAGLTDLNFSGDQIQISQDPSIFRTGSWSVTPSGTLYALVGELVMQYWTHNVAVDGSGNFLGRDDQGTCTLWTYTESSLIKIYNADIDITGTLPVWTLVSTQDATTGNITVTQVTASVIGHASLDLPLTGGNLIGSLDMGNNKITSLATPIANTDAATKLYVDNLSVGILPQTAVKDVALIDDSLSTPPGSPITGVTYLIGVAPTGAWTAIGAGRLTFWNGSAWIDSLGRVIAINDRLGINIHSRGGTLGGSFIANQDNIATVTNATPGSYTYTFAVPVYRWTINDNNSFSFDVGDTYYYNGSAWQEINTGYSLSGGNAIDIVGNIINVLYDNASINVNGSNQLQVIGVGGSSAANVHAAELLANAATNLNTINTIVKRDSSGNFSAGTIQASLTGNVLGNVSGTSATFTGNLTGDVTSVSMATSIGSTVVTGKLLTGYIVGTNTAIAATDSILGAFQKVQGQMNVTITSLTSDVTTVGSGAATATVAFVGTSSAANVHAAELLANAATNLNTASAIVKRDSSGNFTAGTITANLTGHASLDLALTGGTMSGAIAMGGFNITGGGTFTGTGATLSGLTQGSVLFSGTSGVVSQDNAKLFWDDTNFRLGVNFTSPTRHLQVTSSDAANTFYASYTGTTVGATAFEAYNTGAQAGIGYAGYISKTGAGTTNVGLYTDASGGTNNYGLIVGTGLVGIGITSPTSLLHLSDTVAKTTTYISNEISATNTSSTSSINKTAVDIQSTGTWNGTSAINTGLNVNVSGGTTNYAAILSGGNVGIGISSPLGLLHAEHTGASNIYVGASDNTTSSAGGVGVYANTTSGPSFTASAHAPARTLARYGITLGGWAELYTTGTGNNGLILATQTATPTVFVTNNTERMRIDSGGLVGIGTTTPFSPLEVVGAVASGYGTPAVSGTTDNNVGFRFRGYTGLAYVLDHGTTGQQAQWLQSRNSLNLAVQNPLLLNPNGSSAGFVGINTLMPSGPLSVTPYQYGTGNGTAFQVTTTVTGVGTTWTSAMIGSQFVFSDGTSSGTITAVGSTTSLTVSTSRTVSSTPGIAYVISYTGLQVASTSNVGIGTIPSQKLHIQGGNFLVTSGSSADANSGLRIVAPVSTSHYNWMIGVQQNISAGFEITPSTAVGGTTFSTPALTVLQGGNVGIGTANPLYKVDIIGAGKFSTTDYIAGTTGSSLLITPTTTGNTFFEIQTYMSGGTTYGNLMLQPNGGNIGIGITAPVSNIAAAAKFLDITAAAGSSAITIHGNGNTAQELSIQNDGVGTYIDTGGALVPSNNFIQFRTNNTASSYAMVSAMRIDSQGRVGIGNVPSAGWLQIQAGTAAIAPISLTSGTNLTSAAAGAIEFDGVSMYGTTNTGDGRGRIPLEQYFHLTATGGTISTIANYFGTTSNPSLVSGGYYEIEITMYYLKTTAGTVTWTLTNSATPTNMNYYYEMSPITGIVAPPGTTSTMIAGQIYGITSAASSFTTGSLTTGVNHYARFKIFLSNGTGTSLKIQATASAGTITPGIGSTWTSRRIPTGNTGTFAA